MSYKQGVENRLVDAYRHTRYIVEAPSGELVLSVGQPNALADGLLEDFGAKSCAFITACNPGSRELTSAENEQRHRELTADVGALGYKFFSGRGVGEDPTWTPERSLFIIGIDRTEAEQLGGRFGQLAIIIKRVGEPVELCLLE
jgi:hypothetical protein